MKSTKKIIIAVVLVAVIGILAYTVITMDFNKLFGESSTVITESK